jgi:hypothetical protein
MPIAAMGANPYAEPLLWEWFVNNLQQLEKMHPLHLERVITGITPIAGIEKAPEIRGFLENYVARSPKVRDAVTLALEKLEINMRMRRV